MLLSKKAMKVYKQASKENVKLGDIRKLAKEIKTDQELALELWSTGEFYPRQLSILILDKKQLSHELIESLYEDIKKHSFKEMTHLSDWLMANQLMKDKKLISMIESWQNDSCSLKRRTFWYYQARLRWMGKTDFDNTKKLLDIIEASLVNESPEVQWAMNFTAGQIGKWQKEYRERCINIGKETGLYKDEKAPKGCTPNYLPDFISIEVEKLKKVTTHSR